jgi:tol-pal system protein YbgF
MPEVKQACRQVLEEMAFTIKEKEAGPHEYRVVAVASQEYEVDITITRITANATRVSVNADALPERDQATGKEIISQMASLLSPPRYALSAVPQEETAQLLIDLDQSPIPVVEPVRPAPAGFPPPLQPSANPALPPMANHRPKTHEERANVEQTYEAGLQAYIDGNYSSAITHFRAYLDSQPPDGQAPKALYWLGESLYNQRRHFEALLQFQTILRDFPQSPEVPRALLRGADACRELGETHQAEALLEILITEHPRSREAHVARPGLQGE